MAANGPPEQSDNSPQNDQPSGRSFTISGRTLMIAGGVGGVALVVVIAVVLWQMGMFAGGGRGATGGGAVLGYIPADAGLVVIGDNEAILNGDVSRGLRRVPRRGSRWTRRGFWKLLPLRGT